MKIRIFFVYSSINLPFNFSQQVNRIEVTKNQIPILYSKIEKAEIDQLSNDFKKEINSILSRQEGKNVEILAIFSAVVLFASGTIQIFKNASTIYQAAFLMGMFGLTSILLFIAIRFLHDSRKCTETFWKYFWAIVITLVSYAAFVIIASNFDSNIYIFDKNQKKTQSTSPQNKLPHNHPSSSS